MDTKEANAVPGFESDQSTERIGENPLALESEHDAVELVSVTGDGIQGNAPTLHEDESLSVSSDGRYVVFVSAASNLVPDDTNGALDVFVKDRETGALLLVSSAADGGQSNDNSRTPTISADGRYVAFASASSNLVVNDTNGVDDVFAKDLQTGLVTLVSAGRAGSQSDGASWDPSLSTHGRYLAFCSLASNLVEGDTNGYRDIFVADLQTGTVTLASASSNGSQGTSNSWDPALSADGRYVAFRSDAPNLTPNDYNLGGDIYVKDLQTGLLRLVSASSNGIRGNRDSTDPTISADGRYVAFASASSNLVANDTNGVDDVFVKDLQTGILTRVSTAADGGQANTSGCNSPAISADGRYVAFQSNADNLTPGETYWSGDVFVKDTQTGVLWRMSVAPDGSSGHGDCPAISADGQYVAFESGLSNLVPNDFNRASDVFIADRQLFGLQLFGTEGSETLGGGERGDILDGLTGDDQLLGLNGVDILIGGAGNDTLDGGDGADTASYLIAVGSVTVNLATVTATGADGNDTLVSIENVRGSRFGDLLVGDDGANRLLGDGYESYGGPGGDDTLDGGLGDDTLHGGTGNDTLDGGGGRDTALYDAALTTRMYTVTRTSVSYAVVDPWGGDTLVAVERLQFADFAVGLTVQDAAAGLARADLDRLEELYVAFFNRTPDADGLEYWIGRFKGGMTINEIAESFYTAGVLFSELTGYSEDMTNADFVNVVYRNVLGRQDGADEEGLAYWTGELAAGRESRGSLVSTILDSAHSFKGDPVWGWVPDLLDNKIVVADMVAVAWGLNYLTAAESIAQGMAIAAAVTPTDTEAAIALVGIEPGQLDLMGQ